MAVHFKEWLKTDEIKKLIAKKTGPKMSVDFFRDPFRPIHYNPALFYAPADGIVLYTMPRVDPDDFLTIKGKDYTLKDLMHNKDYNSPSLVVGIFMSALDVHINRMPCNAIVTDVHETPNLFTRNSSMIPIEEEFLSGKKYSIDNLAYLFSNERKVTEAYSTLLKTKFYLVQIADKDVGAVVNWGKHKYFTQGERFGQIRWGSQCDLIIPLTTGNMYKILVNEHDHVEAGLDPIVTIV